MIPYNFLLYEFVCDGSLVRHQDMNPKESQRSVVQASQVKHRDKKKRCWDVGIAGCREGILGEVIGGEWK